MVDVVLAGGIIVDGTGTAGYVTDLALTGDRIARIGDCSHLEAVQRLDCTGLVVAPGFIDAHGHSDELLLVNPRAESKVRQGITTEIGGNCGFSAAPLSQAAVAEREAHFQRYGLAPAWIDFDGFLSALEHRPAAINFCSLAGLGAIRSSIDATAPLPLTREQLDAAMRSVSLACDQGALGVSSGLIYPPGRFADTEELVQLARAASAAGSPLYATHLRSEGDGLLEAVDEALDIGRRADVALQLSHHKAARKKNWGKVHDSLARVERARASGLDAGLDLYPYKASSTTLAVVLPADVNVGAAADVAARLADPGYAGLVAARVELEYADMWGDIYVASTASGTNSRYDGMSIAAIATEMHRTPVAAAIMLLAQERLDVSALFFSMCEDDVRTVLSYGQTCIGSDATALAMTGTLAEGRPHPRAFGTFPRVFKRYVRDTSLLPLAEAVRRATALPARRFRLRRRGQLIDGWFGDVVVFDPALIADTATYEDPFAFPEGIPHVFVNGAAVVRGGAQTGAYPGRVLRRGRDAW